MCGGVLPFRNIDDGSNRLTPVTSMMQSAGGWRSLPGEFADPARRRAGKSKPFGNRLIWNGREEGAGRTLPLSQAGRTRTRPGVRIPLGTRRSFSPPSTALRCSSPGLRSRANRPRTSPPPRFTGAPARPWRERGMDEDTHTCCAHPGRGSRAFRRLSEGSTFRPEGRSMTGIPEEVPDRSVWTGPSL